MEQLTQFEKNWPRIKGSFKKALIFSALALNIFTAKPVLAQNQQPLPPLIMEEFDPQEQDRIVKLAKNFFQANPECGWLDASSSPVKIKHGITISPYYRSGEDPTIVFAPFFEKSGLFDAAFLHEWAHRCQDAKAVPPSDQLEEVIEEGMIVNRETSVGGSFKLNGELNIILTELGADSFMLKALGYSTYDDYRKENPTGPTLNFVINLNLLPFGYQSSFDALQSKLEDTGIKILPEKLHQILIEVSKPQESMPDKTFIDLIQQNIHVEFDKAEIYKIFQDLNNDMRNAQLLQLFLLSLSGLGSTALALLQLAGAVKAIDLLRKKKRGNERQYPRNNGSNPSKTTHRNKIGSSPKQSSKPPRPQFPRKG